MNRICLSFFWILFLSVVYNGFAQSTSILERLNFESNTLTEISAYQASKNQRKALRALLQHYQSKANVYIKVSKFDADFIRKTYPEDVLETLKTADDVLEKNFIFRYDWDMEKTNIPHQFKNDIDWNAIPNGDPEWCFMLNRHRYWVDLGKAYLLTGDEKYVKGFVEQATHWIANNPINEITKKTSWRRIEAGIRCENWIKTFELVKHSKYITAAFLSKFLEALYEHGVYINADFNYFSKTSNWGVLEFHGLFNLANFLSEFKVAEGWKQDAINNLNTSIQLQIQDDGTQWEQSPMYHNEVFHCFMNVNLLAQRLDIDLPKRLIDKTEAMAYANIQWQKPNYHQPLLGDSDDTDLRGLLTLAAYIFKDPKIKSRALNALDYHSMFILGLDQMQAYDKISTQNPEFLSVFQKSSGDVYMRTSWDTDASYTSMHLKKLGGGHGHDNILHFTLFANNRDYLVDNGRYTYVNNQWREFFKSSTNHNSLGVDGLANSVYQGSWSNAFEARSQGIFTKLTTEFDYAEAENTAYKRLEDPVSIKRRLLFLKPDLWLIFDSFSSKGAHRYSQYFNFPNTKVALINNGVCTRYSDNNLRIQPINELEIKLEDSWYSKEYNFKTRSKKVEMFKNATGFTSFISLVYFPENDKVSYTKEAVYTRSGVLLSDEIAEAVTLKLAEKEYTILVVHNSKAPGAHFYKVKDQFVSGEVVLIESHASGEQKNIVIIKE